MSVGDVSDAAMQHWDAMHRRSSPFDRDQGLQRREPPEP